MSLTGRTIRKTIAPLWAKKEGSLYLKYLQGLEKAKSRDFEDIQKDQLQKLQKLLKHAITNTEYYQNRLSGLTNDISTLTWDEFHNIPLLAKEDIRDNIDSMVADNIPASQMFKKSTSGSTGVSLELYVDEESSQWKRAVTISYDRWSGWDIGEQVGAIWGNPEYKENWRTYLRNLLLDRLIYLDTLKMNDETMYVFYQRMQRKKPVILFGHAHSLFLFAKFIDNKNLSPLRFKGIISTCMVLHDFERKVIEKVFGCKVTNRYGCEEVSLISCECSEGNMHLNSDTLIVEFLRDGKPVKPGETGAIVVTDLTNFAMPFIRYKVGDVGVPSTRKCTCGCNYPLMESLAGRVADYVVTPDGNYISGISLTENFAMHLLGVKQMQIVQEKVDFILFKIVKGDSFTEETVRDIDRLFVERFGEKMHYEIEYLDSIQSESSGKYRFCISKLPNVFS